MLADNPESAGSLGIAISEAVEVAATSGGTTKYSLGSVLNHVLLHQTVIGQEVELQMELAGEYPDVVIGCVGGGSNFGGIALPLLKNKLAGKTPRTRFIAVEPTATPSLTKGIYTYDYGDTVHMAPVVKMYTLGHTFVPAGIHAGGLRYHGMSPLISALYNQGYIEARRRASEPDVCGGDPVCEGRRHRAGAGIVARDPGGDRPGAGCQGARREARDPVQPVGPRVP